MKQTYWRLGEELPDPFLAGNRKVIDNVPHKCQIYTDHHSRNQPDSQAYRAGCLTYPGG